MLNKMPERPLEPPVPKLRPVMYCDECGEPIYEGEEFMELPNGLHWVYCEDCIQNLLKVATGGDD